MGALPSMSPAPGPYRPASKGGVYVAMLEFPDIYARFHSLLVNEPKTDTKVCTLAGYTLAVQCTLSMDKSGSVTVLFAVCLIDGPWDNHVEWPFGRKITLTLAHPLDNSKDISWPVVLDQRCMVGKPEPGRGNVGACSGAVEWDLVRYTGFIVSNSLYLHIELQ